MFQTFLSTCATLKDMIKRKRFQVFSPPPNPQIRLVVKLPLQKKTKIQKNAELSFF